MPVEDCVKVINFALFSEFPLSNFDIMAKPQVIVF